MFSNIMNYFNGLNSIGQALFVVGMLLVATFIILLIVVLKPEKKGKIKKVYGESPLIDKENDFEEKMKNVININDNDINIDNDRTKNLKSIVDQLKSLEAKNNDHMSEIKKYEAEQEDTAIISVEELLRKSGICDREPEPTNDIEILEVEETRVQEIRIPVNENTSYEEVKEPERYIPRQEVFSPVFNENKEQVQNNNSQNNNSNNNEVFLNSLKEFRNNL